MGLLVLGIGLVGAVVGFMVGASDTPVVGTVIPVVFGVITAALAVIGRSPLPLAKELVELANNQGWQDRAQELLDTELRRARGTPLKFGVVLVVFAVLYAAGSFAGVQARTNAWLLPRPVPAPFPWNGAKAPGTVERALEWLTVAQSLRAAGYSDEHIQDLYKIESNAIQTVIDRASATQPFPWDSPDVGDQAKAAPTTVTAVMEWISFRDFLLARGFSNEQVANLYQAVQLDENVSVGAPEPPPPPWNPDVIPGGGSVAGLPLPPQKPNCGWYCYEDDLYDFRLPPSLPEHLLVPFLRNLPSNW